MQPVAASDVVCGRRRMVRARRVGRQAAPADVATHVAGLRRVRILAPMPGIVTDGLDPKRILLIKPSSLGDIVHALPVLAGLRERYPHAHIAWLVNTSFRTLLDDHPLLDEVIPFDRKRYGRMLRSPAATRAFLDFTRELRARRFELVIDLQGLIRTGFLSWASGARRRVGFASAREIAWAFYTDLARTDRRRPHAVDRNVQLAAALGLPVSPPRFPLGLRDEERVAARALLEAEAGGPLTRFTAVVPGARWATKRWPAARFGALVRELTESGQGPCVLLGAPDERDIAAEIVAAARPTSVIDLVGRTTLRGLAAVLERAERVVCCDSGPMHLAAALNRPTVALFGPTSAARTGPYSPHADVVAPPIYCAPCYRRRCWHHSCMKMLAVETVADHVRRLPIVKSAPENVVDACASENASPADAAALSARRVD